MNLDTILVRPPKGYWLSELDSFRNKLSSARPTGHHLDQICELVSLEARSGHEGRLTNWLSLGLLLDASRFVTRIKRSGALRASKYEFAVKKIRLAVEAILKASSVLNMPIPVIHYFNSINGLLAIADDVFVLRRDLERNLQKSPNVSVKSVIAMIDSRFAMEFVADRDASTNDWRHYFREELAEAASYCLHLFNKTRTISANHFTLLDERGVVEGKWMSFFVLAAKIRSFVEWEILVDSDLHNVEHESEHAFVVRPLDARTEKSIRLGFISAQMAELKEVIATRDVKALDQAKFAEELHALFKANDLITIVDKPLRRIVLKFPLMHQLKQLISQTTFFLEEGAYLKSILKLCLMDFNSLFDHKIGNTATLWDLMVVWRLLHILGLTFWRELRRFGENDPELVVRSQLPVFQIDQLESFLELVVSADACKDIVQLLRWPPSDGAGILDLQYRPFVTADGFCILPLNIIGQSNFIRIKLRKGDANLFYVCVLVNSIAF